MGFAAGAVLVVLLVLVVHHPVLEVGLLGHDTFPIIATSVLEAGGHLGSVFGLRLIAGDGQLDFYRPLINLLAAIEYPLFGFDPRAYQVTSLAIFTACAVALYALVRRMSGAPAAALLAAAAFVLHPATLEAVPFVPRRPESLCCLFVLLALHASISPGALPLRRPPILPGLFALLALGAKETGLLLPLLGFVLVFLYSERTDLRERVVHAGFGALPLAVAVGIATLARLAVIGGMGGYSQAGFGNLGEAGDLLLWVALPTKWMQEAALAPWLVISIALALATSAMLRWKYRASEDPWSPRARAAAFAATWLVAMLLLHAFTGRIQPWYALFPAAGWCMLLGISIEGLVAAGLRPGAVAPRVASLVSAILLAALLGGTLRYSPVFVGYDALHTASRFEEEYLAEIARLVEKAPPGSVVVADRVPSQFDAHDGAGPRSIAMLHYYSVQAWLDLSLPDRRILLTVTPRPADFEPLRRRVVLAVPGHRVVRTPPSPASGREPHP